MMMMNKDFYLCSQSILRVFVESDLLQFPKGLPKTIQSNTITVSQRLVVKFIASQLKTTITIQTFENTQLRISYHMSTSTTIPNPRLNRKGTFYSCP